MNLEELLDYLDTIVLAKTHRHLKDVEVLVLRGSWQGQNYETIAEQNGYTPKYLAQDVGPKLWKLLSEVCEEKVSKTNFQVALERQYQKRSPETSATLPLLATPPEYSPGSPAVGVGAVEPTHSHQPASNLGTRYDLDRSIDVSRFYGRTAELAQLNHAIIDRRCRVVALVGMSGVGKTTLTAKWVQQGVEQFDCVILRSLRSNPAPTDLMTTLWQFLSNTNEPLQGNTVEQHITQLLQQLRQQRSLIVLDDWESLFQEGELAGYCMPQYQGYSRFLTRVAEEHHQSCILLISQQQPIEISTSIEPETPIYTFKLRGLQIPEAERLLAAIGLVPETPGLTELVQIHRGNPAALKITATTIQELFDGNVVQFLKQSSLVLGDVLSNRLAEQLERFSERERTVMNWLSIAGQPLSLVQLRSKLDALSTSELLTALESLQRRSLLTRIIDPSSDQVLFTLEPAVIKYVTQQLVLLMSEALCQAVVTQSVQQLGIFNDYPLLLETEGDPPHPGQSLLLYKVQDKLRVLLSKNAQQLEIDLKQLLSHIEDAVRNNQYVEKYAKANLLGVQLQNER
jgi:ABC-type dipeptide/oligopeptide/nickel transport system ATPase subunit